MGKLYFVDGYHGGVRGHMPEGSWQDILHAMESYPSWKISLEIEPESWEYIRKHDFHTYCQLQKFVSDPATSERVEFISGSYAQPFCWAVNGESNIRQLIHGVEVINRHFPEIVIDTYAVQEPCFTSSLPQILKQLGYVRMSLKNPTAWGGYMAKMPGEILNLCSHDGSYLPAVPRYECEELISCNATEASGYDFSTIEGFADKCNNNGIKAPVGMCLQDLGWSSKPLVQNMDVEYVTWREYFQRFGTSINGNVEFSQEDVQVALPWGNRIFQEMLRNVRNAENRILQTEKLLSIAESQNGDMEKGRLLLEEAWEMLMQAQHHDGYICATCGEGTRMWAFQSNALTAGCCSRLDNITDLAMEAVSGKQCTEIPSEKDIWLRVYNTVGNPRVSQAEVTLGLDFGTRSLKVYDENDNEILSQLEPTRFYADGSIGAAILRFYATVDGIGYSTYRVVPSDIPANEGQMAIKTAQNTIELTNDYLHIVFDLTKGGSIVRLFDKETKRDYAAGISGLGTLRGYSISENRFIGTMDTPVECKIIANGSIYTELCFIGQFQDIEFQNIVKFRLHDRRIDFETMVNFKKDTDIGYPYEPKVEERYHGTKRSSCREDYKLGIQFPLGNNPIKIMKSAPFDLYESGLSDTRFDSWETIKHNIINGYADFYQESSATGLAIFCDHVNGYSLAENLFTLTLGFGYHGNFWWGYQPLRGKCKIKYSILPHEFNWEQAQIPYEDTLVREPLLVQRLSGKPDNLNLTVFCCENNSVETVTILRRNGKSQVRLFHSSYKREKINFRDTIAGFRAVSVNLLGLPDKKNAQWIDKLEIKTLI
jgi:alpha-mannosidase